MNIKSFCVFLFSIIFLSGCSTIQSPSIAYLGDLNIKEQEVVGTSSHYDFAGISVTDSSLAQEYKDAIGDAINNAPSGTIGLKNIKAFSRRNWAPQIFGVFLCSLGTSMAMAGAGVEPSFTAMVVGAGLSLVNIYSISVMATPVIP